MALTNDDMAVREAAAAALADANNPAIIPALLTALTGTDNFVLTSALNALKQFRDPRSKTPALSLLHHADPHVRRQAVIVLGYLGEIDTLTDLGNLISTDPDNEVRRSAVGAIQFANAENISPWLITALADLHWQVRAEAAKGLGRLAIHSAHAELIHLLNDNAWQVVEQSILALGALQNPAAISAIGSELNHIMANVRKAVVSALGEIKHIDAIPYLQIALQDADPDVRKIARWALHQVSTHAS